MSNNPFWSGKPRLLTHQYKVKTMGKNSKKDKELNSIFLLSIILTYFFQLFFLLNVKIGFTGFCVKN
jgi:hypothetical protein